MVFSAEGRILIKVWPANSPDLNLVDYRISGETARACLPQLDSWPADQLKSRLIEEWEQFQQSDINEAVKQWR